LGIFFQKGIHVRHNKRTSALQPVRIEHCSEVTLLMKQHIGAPCRPLVVPGDLVKVGQVIGDTDEGLAVPLHASISGRVARLEILRVVTGEDVKAVVITSDGKMTLAEDLAPPVLETQEDFFRAVRASGLVGLGGAGFPTHAKLRSAAGDADTLLVNAAECEPYITADHREALDAADDVMEGIALIARFLGIHTAVIGIENNKGDAIAKLRSLCAQASSHALKISTGILPSRYPQGAEKVFIHSLTGRVVPVGALPSAVGVLVMNLASVAFLGRYAKTGRPLISRTVTVDGSAVAKPMNVRVPIGIKLNELTEFSGQLKSAPAKIILSGPMMGTASPDLNAPISKCNNAVLLFDRAEAAVQPESACIRCGACVRGCPMKLQPLKLEAAYRAGNAAALRALCAMNCMECGCCSYVCPAKRELVQRIRLGKGILRTADTKAKADAAAPAAQKEAST
jgi:electron transport complex protein RnfC